MTSTSAQTVFASPVSKSQPPAEAEQNEVSQPTLLPEIFLLIMRRLTLKKHLSTLFNLAIANKACSELALPILKNFPHRDVWLAIEDRDMLDGNNGVHVRAAFTKKASAQKYLEAKVGRRWLGDEPSDFEKEPFTAESGEEGFTYLIEKHHLIGPLLKPEGHVWVRSSVIEQYEWEQRSFFEGLFTSEEEAREGIEEGSSGDDEKRVRQVYGGEDDGYDSEEDFYYSDEDEGPKYRFESFKLRD